MFKSSSRRVPYAPPRRPLAPLIRKQAETMTKTLTHFVSLGMFIIDQFEFLDTEGKKTGKELEPQVTDAVSISLFAH